MILVLGSKGQVASELKRLPGVVCLARPEMDFRDVESVRSAVLKFKPSAIINAAAYTSVDQAESDEKLAYLLNCHAPRAIAEICNTLSIPLIHISTDYVFDGTKRRQYLPHDPCNPINLYGASKRAGELAVSTSGCQHVTLRTSWIFSAYGANFVKTMLRIVRQNKNLSVVSDQFGGPTSARSIAEACLMIANKARKDSSVYGTFHFSGCPIVSWFEFANEIFYQAGVSANVKPISTSEFSTIARRPAFSALNCDKTFEVFGISQPDWRADLGEVLSELGSFGGAA